MLSSVVAAILLASSASHVAAGPLESRHKHIARGYAQDANILEDYTPYHVRYLALECHEKHNTTFFDKCCHPLLRWQKLSDRPKECIPSPAASSAAAVAEPTAAPIDEDPIDDECDPEDDPEEEDCDDEPTTATLTSSVAPSTTHKPQPPVTTSSKAPEPEPTTTKQAHSEEPTSTSRPSPTRMTTSVIRTTSAEPSPTPKPDDDNNNGGQTITGGTATFFKQNGGMGACGKVNPDSAHIVAMDYRMYGDENSRSKYCGSTVRITNKKNGKQADAVVADCCPTCVSRGSLDMSTGLFHALGGTDEEGVFPIEYTILN